CARSIYDGYLYYFDYW
nr:immunoglobulin heavy chain junction region [Mus musculus]MBK4189180.1 immunoglobulin heavy chain junction region [Mus musculus]